MDELDNKNKEQFIGKVVKDILIKGDSVTIIFEDSSYIQTESVRDCDVFSIIG